MKIDRQINLPGVGDEPDLHETAVGHTCWNKTIMKLRGVHKLKLLPVAMYNSTGDEHSSVSVKHRLRAITENFRVLLDNRRIPEALQNSGIRIARQTIVNDRQNTNIQPQLNRTDSKSKLKPQEV